MRLFFTRKAVFPVFMLLIGCGAPAQVSFTLPPNAGLANISNAEYYFDTDPGPGLGTAQSLSPGTNITISNAVIPVAGLSNGVHRFYTRTRDINGHWSLTNNQVLFIVNPVAFPSSPALVNIIKAEYFFDTDPGPGLGTALSVTPGTNITIGNAAIPITGLSSGVHRLYIRTANTSGHWSLTNNQVLFIVNPIAFPSNPALVNVVKAEYFFDTDPGTGLGSPLAVTPGTNVTIGNAIPVTGLATGLHRLYIRTADAKGHWSLTNENNLAILTTSLIIPSNPVPGNITLLEYFFDSDPGFGKGHMITVAGTANLVNYSFPVDVSGLTNGTHNLFIRAFDGWSQTTAVPLSIGPPLPITLISFTAGLQSDNSVALNWTTVNEANNAYFSVERRGEGAFFSPIGEVKGGGTTGLEQSYGYSDPAPLAGINYYRLKQVDLDGRSAYSPVVSIRVQNKIAFSVVPNPVHDLLTLHIGAPPEEKGILRIVDLEGKIVLSANATQDNVQQIDVSRLASGSYILQYLTSKNSRLAKFIKF